FATADGWIVVGGVKQDAWERLCQVLSRPELNDDPRFATRAARDIHRDVLLPILDDAFRQRSTDEWLEALVAARVPASRINPGAPALAEPQTVARGAVVEHEHPALGTVRSIRTPLRLAGEEGSLERVPERGPLRGEHTDSVLQELCGYTKGRIDELARQGV